MKANTKSILVARKKINDDDLPYVVEIKLFDINNPHLTTEVPKKVLEFKDIECVLIKELSTYYYIRGNDIVINDAVSVKVEQKKDIVIIERE